MRLVSKSDCSSGVKSLKLIVISIGPLRFPLWKSSSSTFGALLKNRSIAFKNADLPVLFAPITDVRGSSSTVACSIALKFAISTLEIRILPSSRELPISSWAYLLQPKVCLFKWLVKLWAQVRGFSFNTRAPIASWKSTRWAIVGRASHSRVYGKCAVVARGLQGPVGNFSTWMTVSPRRSSTSDRRPRELATPRAIERCSASFASCDLCRADSSASRFVQTYPRPQNLSYNAPIPRPEDASCRPSASRGEGRGARGGAVKMGPR